MVELDRSKIKFYFIGKSQTLPILLMIFGIILMAWKGFMILVSIGGLAWYLYNKFSADLSGQDEVDKAIAYETELARKRAMEKLNLIDSQVSEVEPVLVFGRGFEPVSPTQQLMGAAKKGGKILSRSMLKKSDDPIYLLRIGSDEKVRCSLARHTIFMFGEKQLYIYFSNVDLTTGIVYSEGTHEYFYSDINGITFTQDKEKIFNYRKKKYVRVLFESVQVYTPGCSYTATLSTELDKSFVEREFTGMRNLIRDRKNAE